MKDKEWEKAQYMSMKNKLIDISEHYDGCRYENTSIPINECRCDCYERQVFMLGFAAHEKSMYGSDRRLKDTDA